MTTYIIWCLMELPNSCSNFSFFFFKRHRLRTCVHKIPQLQLARLITWPSEIPARWRQPAMNSTVLELHPQSRDLNWKVEHLCQRQPVSAYNWIYLSLFLFWFCDFSALYRNGIFWHLNKGDLSSKVSLFVSRILYSSSPQLPSPHQRYFFFSL